MLVNLQKRIDIYEFFQSATSCWIFFSNMKIDGSRSYHETTLMVLHICNFPYPCLYYQRRIQYRCVYLRLLKYFSKEIPKAHYCCHGTKDVKVHPVLLFAIISERSILTSRIMLQIKIMRFYTSNWNAFPEITHIINYISQRFYLLFSYEKLSQREQYICHKL